MQPLLFDCTWSQQWKYESAEAYYQAVLAGSAGAAGQVTITLSFKHSKELGVICLKFHPLCVHNSS